ncbi:hypothetical protein ACQ4PT_067743 [Festuca glaucescens]
MGSGSGWQDADVGRSGEAKRFVGVPACHRGRSMEQDRPPHKRFGNKIGQNARAAQGAPIPPPRLPLRAIDGPSLLEGMELEKTKDKAAITCFNCSNTSHYQSSCILPPHCALCDVDVDGNTTGMCPVANKALELRWYGYGVDGVGFFAMDFPDSTKAGASINSAVVLVDDVHASASIIEEGLKMLVDEQWD